MPPSKVVTIDGPAGAGKSTIARRLSGRLGWRLLDTGAMYRAVTVAAIRRKVDLQSEAALAILVATIHVSLVGDRVMLDGEDISSDIRTIEVTRFTRYSADSPSVRAQLVDWQRAFARSENHIITEGRDQGTIVFPKAFRKFYLTASDHERARRRHAEFVSRGDAITFEAVLKALRDRDDQDAGRVIAPMKPAEDAVVIDTTGRDLVEIVGHLERVILETSTNPD